MGDWEAKRRLVCRDDPVLRGDEEAGTLSRGSNSAVRGGEAVKRLDCGGGSVLRGGKVASTSMVVDTAEEIGDARGMNAGELEMSGRELEVSRGELETSGTRYVDAGAMDE
jgi:hypothetical protein